MTVPRRPGRPHKPAGPTRDRRAPGPAPARRPPGAEARAAALAALRAVAERGIGLEAALEAAPGFFRLEPRDRAFARLLAATALRRAGEIEAITARLVERPVPKSARALGPVLALGIVQLLFLATPAHAAVATSVALAEAARLHRYKGLVNAVLRRVATEGAALLEGLDAARLDTPGWLWDSWARAYGEDAARRIAEVHLTEAPLDLTPRDPRAAEPLAGRLEARLLPTGTLRRASGGAIPDLPGYAEGAWWVQDAAAALPARLLGEIAGRRVLDLCAAPGGKTLQLAAEGARVTAVDASEARLDLVRANLARTGLDAELIAADGRDFTAAPFDAVLLDAPCTATGTIRRHPDIARVKQAGDAARLAPLQDALLANAALLTRPGGVLVYAVCSLQPEEGEGRIEAFLAAHPDFTIEAVTPAELGGLEEAVTPDGRLRTLPFFLGAQGGMDGFYAARLRRSGEAAT